MSNVIDWNDSLKNMYGCAPCPQCGSKCRAPYKSSKKAKEMGAPTIECDDCGHVERVGNPEVFQ